MVLELFTLNMGAAAVRMALPIIAAGIGELVSQKAGIINVGIEGTVLAGAFGGYAAFVFSGNPWIGLLGGILSGMLASLVHAYSTITLRINQIVSGIAINILSVGTTTTLARFLFSNTGVQSDSLPMVAIPVLQHIPIIGFIFFRQNVLVFIVAGIVLLTHFVLFKTHLGLRIRATGEHPKAADTAGISVIRLRYMAVLFAGAMAGIAGSYLSLVQLNVFVDNMSAGKGWIALTAVIFGRWRPGNLVMAGLLFGTLEAIGVRSQALGLGIPYEVVLMLPYLVTLIAFVFLVGSSRAPRSMGKPYPKV